MKLAEAEAIIHKRNIEPSGNEKGFIVTFEKRANSVLASDHFPDIRGGEEPIKGEENAWRLAKKFAAATDNSIVNIYVCYGDGPYKFKPVIGYDSKMIRRYRPGYDS